jgi:hypothetical protein
VLYKGIIINILFLKLKTSNKKFFMSLASIAQYLNFDIFMASYITIFMVLGPSLSCTPKWSNWINQQDIMSVKIDTNRRHPLCCLCWGITWSSNAKNVDCKVFIKYSFIHRLFEKDWQIPTWFHCSILNVAFWKITKMLYSFYFCSM